MNFSEQNIKILPPDPSHSPYCKEVNRVKSADLKNIPTNRLVEELAGRDGVEKVVLLPYEKSQIEVEGPVIVLMVTD